MIRSLLALVLIGIGVGAVLAQSDPVAARRELMKGNAKYAYTNFNRMVRGQKDYDQATVDEGFANFIEVSKKFPTLFPEGTFTGPTANDDFYASQKIWENKAEFEARAAKLGKVAEENRGKIKDLDSLKAIWPAMNKDVCDGCHEQYRPKKAS
jgi:cytochrome c556